VSTKNIEAFENGTNETDKNNLIEKDESLLKNWPLMSSIIVYCVFAIHDIAFSRFILQNKAVVKF
jgi:hypothetical protein